MNSKQYRSVQASVCLAFLLSATAPPANSAGNPGAHWESAGEQTAGWSVEKLGLAEEEAKRLGSTAVLVVEHGKIVADWGASDQPVYLHSVRKSLVSALYGIAVENGRIDPSETLADLGIDDKPPALTDEEKKATIADLLKARSGIYHAAADEAEWMKKARPERGSHAPGTFWYYNNWDFNALGTIYRLKTGAEVFEAFAKEIAGPIGMEDFDVANCKDFYDPASIHPAYRFSMSARDLARFGLLYLHRGKWGDRQIVPAAWIDESLKPWSNAQLGVGYGYLWWVSLAGMQFQCDMGKGAYSARGVGGQFLVVAPAMDLIIVHLLATNNEEKGIENADFGTLLKLIMAARDTPEP